MLFALVSVNEEEWKKKEEGGGGGRGEGVLG